MKIIYTDVCIMVHLCMYSMRIKAALICLAIVVPLIAQTMSTGAAGYSRATPLPASGRLQPGSVVAQQSATAGAGVDTVNSSIAVSGDFSGSVPVKNVPAGAVTLTLADAVKFGLAANLGTISADNSVRASRAARIQELSALLPNIAAQASETVNQVNLAAYGFQFKLPPGINFSIPSVVGPFSYSQLTGTLSHSIYDPVQRRNWQSSKEGERASVQNAKDARELVVLAVGGAYLQTVTTAARIDSQRAQVSNAQAVYQQAVTRKEAGTNSKIDVMRSLVELQTQQQRLNSLQSDLRKQKITLARITGLPLDREVVLSEPLNSTAPGMPQPEATIAQAFEHRADLRAAEMQVQAAKLALSAAHAERLPSASVNGDYGVLGPNPASTHGVFAVTGTVTVPIWRGGRVRGDIEQADSTLQQRQAELADQRSRVEQDVRNALIELQTAEGQVQLAQSNRGYANETLAEARDRFSAGVATTVEVVQAQEQVAGAESDYISSLFSLDVARLALARATGSAETSISDLLNGTRP
jgi:outer membrane protein TolC